MKPKNDRSKTPWREATPGPDQPAPAAPPGPAGGTTPGPPAAGPPDAAAVCRALKLLRDVMDGTATGDGLGRFTIALVDDLLPVLDDAILLLGSTAATVSPAGGR